MTPTETAAALSALADKTVGAAMWGNATTLEPDDVRLLRNAAKLLAASSPDVLRQIGDMAHDASTGPEVPDTLWEIRGLAYGALS